jgi:hypothetical protein
MLKKADHFYCVAIKKNGERCKNLAGEGGLCNVHVRYSNKISSKFDIDLPVEKTDNNLNRKLEYGFSLLNQSVYDDEDSYL